MSWVLFAQLFVLILLVGCIAMAVLNRMYEDSPPTTRSDTERIVHYGYQSPIRPAENGDMWVSPEEGRVRVWNSSKGRWDVCG